MHIKKIIIQGFKTYKNTTVIDLLSPHHNVVVGRNGSGKSNFFAAIRFVLSDAYTHMTREERQGLIHEGSGTVMSAYVEIVFDNTERRFPIGKDEVSIRRTIGLKKDDYSLDNKSASRSDVMNLLESAGFSRSNPYYIVPQGRITALTNSKDSERLTLLKEVSGAKVFEAKLKESLKEMNNSNLKKERIDETLRSIEERLSDLQIESQDLNEYQNLEKSKKVLEFNLFDRELNDTNSQLEDITITYDQLLADSQNDLDDLDKREKLSKQLSESINELQRSLKVATLEKEQTELDYNQILAEKTDLSIKISELENQLVHAKEQTTKDSANLEHYQSLIEQREGEIAKFKPELESKQSQELQVKQNLNELTTRQRALYSKQNRFSKFKTRAERDKWLKSQIKTHTAELSTKNKATAEVSQDLEEKRAKLAEMDEKIQQLSESVQGEEFQKSVDAIQTTISDLKSQITELTDSRKVLWRDEIRLRSIQDSISNELNNASHLVNQTMDRSQASGLEAVKSITEKLNLSESVYGPLAELFSVNDKYKTAVEVVAGNSLFHIVVDNDKTASLIMNELNRTQMGRVTLIPLNRIRPPPIAPQTEDETSFPLIKKLKYKDERVRPALQQVFGKTLLVINLEKGAELAKKHNVNCITLDGDRADNKGVLTGGYRDYKKSSSRIDALKVLSKKKLEYQENSKALKACLDEIESINPKLTSINNDLQFKIKEYNEKISSLEPIKAEISKTNDIKYNLTQEIEAASDILISNNSVEDTLKIKLEQLEQELASEFMQSLTSTELEELQSLATSISSTEKDLDIVVTELTDLETKLSTYESDLINNYYPYVAKLKSSSNAVGGEFTKLSQLQSELETLQSELEKLNISLDTSESRNQASVDLYKKLEAEVNTNEESLKKSNRQQQQILKKLAKFQESSERELSRRAILITRREEIQRKIRDLGVLPEEAFQSDKYVKFTAEELLKKLNKVNEGLNKYSHINKKAMEQYHTFTNQRDDLAERLQELEKSRESIEALIINLESQKDEAITKSFKEVSDSFSKIFEKLVPAGTGRLIMQKPQTTSGDATSTQTPRTQEIENYVGVSIQVSFNSKSDEQQRIEQLSGGQKSLCAIALILAIQNCDPAPFYLFDEIDANLDTQYRTAVASMINSLSSRAQFICTTFRPEMLQVADKFYGVMFNNKVSSVSEINKEEAMSFVEGQKTN